MSIFIGMVVSTVVVIGGYWVVNPMNYTHSIFFTFREWIECRPTTACPTRWEDFVVARSYAIVALCRGFGEYDDYQW